MSSDAGVTRSGRPQAVEVRRVGASLELRVDGTQASVHKPGGSITGVVWWALAAPVALIERERPRVLVLGLAAGSVARALRALSPEAAITGVEYDAGVVQAARRHFGLDALGIDVVCADALDHLRSERGRYDLVVEDLFLGPVRSVHKPDWLVPIGYPLIGRRLREGGFVVSNTIHETAAIVGACRALGSPVVSMAVRGHWNQVLVSGRTLERAPALRRRFAGLPPLRPALRRLALRTVA